MLEFGESQDILQQSSGAGHAEQREAVPDSELAGVAEERKQGQTGQNRCERPICKLTDSRRLRIKLREFLLAVDIQKQCAESRQKAKLEVFYPYKTVGGAQQADGGSDQQCADAQLVQGCLLSDLLERWLNLRQSLQAEACQYEGQRDAGQEAARHRIPELYWSGLCRSGRAEARSGPGPLYAGDRRRASVGRRCRQWYKPAPSKRARQNAGSRYRVTSSRYAS